MKKTMFLIIILLVLIGLAGFLITTASTKPKKYLALGDSIAEGYGLSNQNDRYVQIIKNEYRISNENFIDLSKSGMTAKELSEYIKTDEYTKAIKDADLITISIGSNEILQVLTNIANQTPITELLEELSKKSTEEKMQSGINQYEQCWKKIINYIKELNASARIIVTEFYNPYSRDDTITKIAKSYLEKMNSILKEQSENESKYKIAKIYNDFNDKEQTLTNANIDLKDLRNMNIDPHPNKEGHKAIANRIIDEIK